MAKLERIEATCEVCGGIFKRSIAHPYIVKCDACKKREKSFKKKKKSIDKHKKICKHMLENTKFFGQYSPSKRENNKTEDIYWVITQGFYRELCSNLVYYWGFPVGEMYGMNLKEIIQEAKVKYPESYIENHIKEVILV